MSVKPCTFTFVKFSNVNVWHAIIELLCGFIAHLSLKVFTYYFFTVKNVYIGYYFKIVSFGTWYQVYLSCKVT